MPASSPGLDSCFIIYKSWETRGKRGFRHEFPLQEKNYKWVDQYQEYVSPAIYIPFTWPPIKFLPLMHLKPTLLLLHHQRQVIQWIFIFAASLKDRDSWRIGKEKSKEQRWCHLLSIYKSVKALNQEILCLSLNTVNRVVASLCVEVSLRHH